MTQDISQLVVCCWTLGYNTVNGYYNPHLIIKLLFERVIWWHLHSDMCITWFFDLDVTFIAFSGVARVLGARGQNWCINGAPPPPRFRIWLNVRPPPPFPNSPVFLLIDPPCQSSCLRACVCICMCALCVLMCTCVYMCSYVYVCVSMCLSCTCVQVCVLVCACVCVHVSVHACVCACMFAFFACIVCACVCLHMWAYVCECMCACEVCMCALGVCSYVCVSGDGRNKKVQLPLWWND